VIQHDKSSLPYTQVEAAKTLDLEVLLAEVARAAGLPPLELMEGFFTSMDRKRGWTGGMPTFYLGPNPDELALNCIERLEKSLPILWECLKPSALHELLYHSDCDGDLPAASCGPIADALEEILPNMPQGDGGGHIGDWRAKTQQFIDGLRAAAANGEPVEFH
jgi:hypothetical protein